MEKIDRSHMRKIRYAFQWAIVGLTVYSGIKLYYFSAHFLWGGSALPERPPMVDGFLPIGALMSLKLWILNGIFDPVHPSALVIFLGAIVASVTLKKSFCGWICPVGTISEAVYKLGGRVFGGNPRIHPYIDYPLRGIKYVLLGFFAYVAIAMTPEAIIAFLSTAYWKIADIKMLLFFVEMSRLTLIVLSVLFVLSLIFKNFWCRYLCPYGALLGLLSYLSPLKIRRNPDKCIDCGQCSRHCPALLPVDKKDVVRSPECTGCLTCVSRCPAKGALDMSGPTKQAVNPLVYIALVGAVFFGIVVAGKITGRWQSNVTYAEYQSIVPDIKHLEHP